MKKELEFAKYKKVTTIAKQLAELNLIDSVYRDDINEIYICHDTHSYWVVRATEGFNCEFEEDDMWVLERERIDKDILINYILNSDYIKLLNAKEKIARLIKYHEDKPGCSYRSMLNSQIELLTTEETILAILMCDSDNGLSNWDIYDYCDLDSLEKELESTPIEEIVINYSK